MKMQDRVHQLAKPGQRDNHRCNGIHIGQVSIVADIQCFLAIYYRNVSGINCQNVIQDAPD